MDREQQKAYLAQVLTPKRLRHSLGVMQVMGDLAEVYGLEREKALTAGLLHDIAKELAPVRQAEIVKEAPIEIRHECEHNFHYYLHGPMGAYLAEKELGIDDSLILDAIAFHTYYGYGANFDAPMCWGLRFADILEPTRDWRRVKWLCDNVDRLAEMVYAGHMAESAFLQTGWLINWFEEDGVPIHPNMKRLYHKLSKELGVDDAYLYETYLRRR